MRILHLMTEPEGGGGAYATALARAAQARGDMVIFAAPSPPSADFRTIPLDWLHPSQLIRAARQADLIHCHGVRSALRRPHLTGTPVIVTPNGLHALHRTRGLHRLLIQTASGAGLGTADAVICVSDDEVWRVARLWPGLGRRTHLIPNGVRRVPPFSDEDRRVARAGLGLSATQPVLLFAGGLRHQKHPELAVRAVAVAAGRLPHLKLLLAGTGPLMPRVRQLAGPEVQILGYRSDLRTLIAGCDAVLNTSRWEGLSLALLEGLWGGRPLILTDAPGNPDAAGDAGFVVPPTVEAVSDAIVRLFTVPGQLKELSYRARKRAEERFDEGVMAKRTLALYDEVVTGSG